MEKFIRKFYFNELIKGGILFVAVGLFYFLITVGIEHFFWLSTRGRMALFWIFIAVELTLFSRFIVYPLIKLFKLKQGINYKQAAGIIGNFFPEVSDKLLNLLQLQSALGTEKNELLLAGIDQKANELSPIPFGIAIDFRANKKYLVYLVIPVFLVLVILFSGKLNLFSESYSRVVNYAEYYEPPAPFSFQILNEELKTQEGNDFELRVTTFGQLQPENIYIHLGEQNYLLRKNADNTYSYNFDRPQNTVSFTLNANAVQSRSYELEVVNVPRIVSMQMELEYPRYINREKKITRGSSTVEVPEGTAINWRITTRNTSEIQLVSKDSTYRLTREKEDFNFSKVVKNNFDYSLSTSNEEVSQYEELDFSVRVIKDEFPEIEITKKRDSLANNLYFKGTISDDYGFSGLYMSYSEEDNPEGRNRVPLDFTRSATFDEFYVSFPDSIALKKGTNYRIYFEVLDNDGVNGAKRSRSEDFYFYEPTESEREDQDLENNRGNIESFKDSYTEFRKDEEEVRRMEDLHKEREQFEYREQKDFEQVLEQEKQHNKALEEWVDKLEENLSDKSQNNAEKEELLNRLEKTKEALKGSKELLEELEKYRNKLKDDAFLNKLEDFSKNRKKQSRNLESLLELTKRFYVKQKTEQLLNKLNNLSEKQNELSESDNNKEAQESLNEEFDKWQNEMTDLEQENEDLRNPRDLNRDRNRENSIQKEMKETLEEMKDSSEAEENRKRKQKSVSDKMKDLWKQMKQNMHMMEQKVLQEDMDMLRQVLSNLLVFSFEQEDLMLDFKELGRESPNLGRYLQHQQVLRENFGHIDDSLYALALRNSSITEEVIDKLEEIDYHMDKALESLSKNILNTGTSFQQYVFTYANDLANMLDNALQNMESMMESGAMGEDSQSNPDDKFQLEDIIKGQEELRKELEEENGKEDTDNSASGEEDEGGDEQSDTEGNGEEENYEEMFEIYKKQSKLRMELENLIRSQDMLTPENQHLLRAMEQVERELLEGGKNKDSERRISSIIRRMLQLKEALYDKEEEERRKATTNYERFERNRIKQEEELKKMFNTEEILERHTLPLHLLYKNLIKDYFKKDD